jgi:hypothetical protein
MKRIWRFVKWSVNDMGWFEYSWFTAAFFVGVGLATDDPERSRIAFIVAISLMVFWMVKFIIWDLIKMSWKRFVEDDEKAFNILKDKNIK